MTLRDKRALAMGGALVLVAVLVLEVFPWVVRSVGAPIAGARPGSHPGTG